MRRKKNERSGLPIYFLDALALALAAMLLLMFSNLSALQSKKPPEKTNSIFVVMCFVEVDPSKTRWKVTWMYRSEPILRTTFDKQFNKKISIAGSPYHKEIDFLNKPFERRIKKNNRLMHFYANVDLSEKENKAYICYGLELLFPIDEEPSLTMEVERAGRLQGKVKYLNKDGDLWANATLLEEEEAFGEKRGIVHPLPYEILVKTGIKFSNDKIFKREDIWEFKKEKYRTTKITYKIETKEQHISLRREEVTR